MGFLKKIQKKLLVRSYLSSLRRVDRYNKFKKTLNKYIKEEGRYQRVILKKVNKMNKESELSWKCVGTAYEYK